MATQDPRLAYVRFYLTVLQQLDGVHAALDGVVTQLREGVSPYREVLATCHDPTVAELLDAPLPAAPTASLWHPEDAAGLTGLTDVYEVLGRFTFQGEEDANLDAVQRAVEESFARLERVRKGLAALSQVPTAATAAAEGLSQKERAEADAERAERLRPFEPVAEQLRSQCAKVLEAVRQIPRPDLADLDGANLAYQAWVKRMQTLYSKALPFLRRALAELCSVAQVEVPASWPEALPLAENLPEELVTAPAERSPEVAQAEARLTETLRAAEELERRARDLGPEKQRVESERDAATRAEAERMGEALVAKNIVRWAGRFEEIDANAASLESLTQQRNARVQVVAQLETQAEQGRGTIEGLERSLTQHRTELAERQEQLAHEKAHPPTLFGKDDWRRRVDTLEQDVEELKGRIVEYERRRERERAEVAGAEARMRAEQSQIKAVEQSIEDARARDAQLRGDLAELEKQLGASKPLRRVKLTEADDYLTSVWNARNEARSRVEYLQRQAARVDEEAARCRAQAESLRAQREGLTAELQRATRQWEQQRQKLLRELALKRQEGFVQYVQRALAPLEESLAQVDRIFVEPARQVLLQRAVGGEHRAGSLRDQAERMAHAVAQLVPRVEPTLTGQLEPLRRAQTEFCDRVRLAVRGAWAA